MNTNDIATPATAQAYAKAKKLTPFEAALNALDTKNGNPVAALNPKAVNFTTLRVLKSEFKQEFTLKERDFSEFSKHQRDRLEEVEVRIQILEFLLVAENFDKFIKPSNPANDYTRAELENLLNFCKTSKENLMQYPNAVSQNEMVYSYGKKVAGGAVNNVSQAQDAVHKIATQLLNAQKTGNVELENVLRLELQAAEARLVLLKKASLT